jgi:hypothetical protein
VSVLSDGKGGVTLQVNVAPVDFPHAEPVLSHQLRQWAGQVDEVIFTLDLHRSAGKYGRAWEERKPKLEALLKDLCERWPSARAVEVDYSPQVVEAVSKRFFGDVEIPVKDCFGAPFYAYFHGLWTAAGNYVLHMDADMMFGGGSQEWIAQAVALFDSRPDVLITGPLPGPPTESGQLPNAVVARHSGTQLFGSAPSREPHTSLAYRLGHMSTRLFMIDLGRLAARVGALELTRPRARTFSKAERHPRYLPAETSMSAAMRQRGLVRIDFLGDPPGMWALHPPYRSAAFYRELSELIRRIESGDVPEAQRGDYDVNDSMIDWNDVRAAIKRQRPAWKRALRRAVRRSGG